MYYRLKDVSISVVPGVIALKSSQPLGSDEVRVWYASFVVPGSIHGPDGKVDEKKRAALEKTIKEHLERVELGDIDPGELAD